MISIGKMLEGIFRNVTYDHLDQKELLVIQNMTSIQNNHVVQTL